MTSDDLNTFLSDSLDIPPDPQSLFVTLTYAQSVDAKIAGKEGKQILLSCKESMLMTHWYVDCLLSFILMIIVRIGCEVCTMPY